MNDKDLARAMKSLHSGDTVDITLRYEIRCLLKDSVTAGYQDDAKLHVLYLDDIVERIVSIKKMRQE